ncbi:hypothetical protein FACS1894169_01080 [Bacteroidia bacterium]|nr:hypothetical protein FACS1894169_01080 [Bacteroidia bacterium]
MRPEDAFLLLFQKFMPKAATITIGTVESVDKEKHTCDVLRDGQPTLFNCRLNAVIDTLDSHVTCFPARGSYVLCITLDEPTSCFVFAYSQLDEAQIKVGKSSAVITKDDILFNGGTLGGLMKISEFTDRLNEFVTTYNGHVHPETGSTTSPTTSQAATFIRDDYENLKIKQ